MLFNFKVGDGLVFIDVNKFDDARTLGLKNNSVYYIKTVKQDGVVLYNSNIFIPKEMMHYIEKALTTNEKITAQEANILINEIESRHVEWAIDSSLESNDKEWFYQIMEMRVFYEE